MPLSMEFSIPLTEDQAIKIIVAHREEIRPFLSVYEMEIIDRAI